MRCALAPECVLGMALSLYWPLAPCPWAPCCVHAGWQASPSLPSRAQAVWCGQVRARPSTPASPAAAKPAVRLVFTTGVPRLARGYVSQLLVALHAAALPADACGLPAGRQPSACDRRGSVAVLREQWGTGANTTLASAAAATEAVGCMALAGRAGGVTRGASWRTGGRWCTKRFRAFAGGL